MAGFSVPPNIGLRPTAANASILVPPRLKPGVRHYDVNPMLLILRRMSLVSICFVAFTVVYPVTAQIPDLTQAQAVEIAEQFVSKNSYFDEARSNAIDSRAVVARPLSINGRSFWSVQFLFRKQPFERKYDFGREVKVSSDGTRVGLGRNRIRVWRHRIPL